MKDNLKELSLGRRIAELRKAQGQTQEALAEALNITAQAVSKWENSQSCPDIMTLPRLAQLLGVSVDMLLTGEAAVAPGTPPPVIRSPEELIVRIMIDEAGGNRFNVNLPFTVFKLGARYGMLSITWNDNEATAEQKASMLAGLDFNTMVRMIESGVTGKLLELTDDGERLVIWTE
ncbi:MAG: helix-turn-helix transcriptional regulator [Clostridia bacterium]|nr:helix-turn-helix transcriptional regulator [Clostridia bacterium]